MYRWIVFVHILSAFAFFMAHGASAMMAFRLQKERDLERIRAILDMSNAALPVAYSALGILLLAGIIAGMMANWFSFGWTWASLVLIVVMWIGMHAYAARFYAPIRKAVGLPYRDRDGEHPPESPASEREIVALIKAANPTILLTFSFGMIAIILYLMMFKPF